MAATQTIIDGTEVTLSRPLRDGDDEAIRDALAAGEESGTIHDDSRDEEGLRWEVVPCGSSPACLTAEQTGDWDDWRVSDAHGGVWCPSEEAAAEIQASDDPEATAVRICYEQPMRGEWRS